MARSSWNTMSGGFQTQVDASYGLIYRMNFLWSEVDKYALRGDFDLWNTCLDRIYCNLLYKNPMEVLEDDNGKIITIELHEKDDKIFNELSNNIKRSQIFIMQARKKKDIAKLNIGRNELYRALMKKDIWLRKFMMELRLYLRETSSNPGAALFGGG